MPETPQEDALADTTPAVAAEPTPETPASAEPTTQPAEAPAEAGDPSAPKPPWGDEANFDADKAWKLIQNLKSDKETAQTKATKADELTQQIGKALGLIEDKPIDAADLTQQLTASQASARQAALELAVFKAAEAAGANPVALTDSRSFMDSVSQADASNLDAIQQAITQAVAANPALARAAGAARPVLKQNPGQGSSALPALSLQDQIAQAQAAGDTRTAMKLKLSAALTD